MATAAGRVLGVFAKRPEPGRVKSRLAVATSPDWAACVAAAFLRDTLDRLAAVDAERHLAFAPAEAREYFARVAAGRYALRSQTGGDLGRRMADFFAGQFRAGAGRVVLVGTDSPTLPLEYVGDAFRALDAADVVLGPAADGGYYLIGLARPDGALSAALFDGVDWGRSRVLADTVSRLTRPDWRLALLPVWYDVDTLDDWQMLCGHLAALRRAGLPTSAPRTEQLTAAATPRR